MFISPCDGENVGECMRCECASSMFNDYYVTNTSTIELDDDLAPRNQYQNENHYYGMSYIIICMIALGFWLFSYYISSSIFLIRILEQ